MNAKQKFGVSPKDTLATCRHPRPHRRKTRADYIYIPQLQAFQHTLKRISPILKKSAVIENSYPALKTFSASHSPHNQEFFFPLGSNLYLCCSKLLISCKAMPSLCADGGHNPPIIFFHVSDRID